MPQPILTPPITYITENIIPPADDGGSPRSAKINVCSEYMPYPMRLSSIQASGKLAVVQISTGEPMLLSLGPDQQLYAFVHVAGGPAIWQRILISPVATAGVVINAFDADQIDTKTVNIAASVLKSDGTSDLYFATWTLPSLSWDDSKSSVSGNTVVPWALQVNNLGALDITAVSLTHANNDFGTVVPTVIVGTGTTAKKTSWNYAVHPLNTQTPFATFTFAGTADSVMDIQAGTANILGSGAFVLYQEGEQVACKFNSLDSTHIAIPVDNTTTKIFANTYVHGGESLSDVFAASGNGIAFFNFRNLDKLPTTIMANLAFKNVTCAEQSISADQSKLAVFALSNHDELYYVEGIRNADSGEVTFSSCSGMPIRRNVEQISSQYNAIHNSAELVYLGNGTDEVSHLRRDPEGKAWFEQTIQIQDVDKNIVNINAFVTSIAVTDASGARLPGVSGFLTASTPTFVTVNGRANTIDSQPTEFGYDMSGKLMIVQAATTQLNPVNYTFSLPAKDKSTTPFQCEIFPAHRVIRQLAALKSGDDIKNATNSCGERVFAQSQKSDADFQVAGQVASNTESFLRSADPSGMDDVLGKSSTTPGNVTVAWEQDGNGQVTQSNNSSWVAEALQGDPAWLGDATEFFKNASQHPMKVAFEIGGGVVGLILQFGGKILRWVVQHVPGPIIQGIVFFLATELGLDPSEVMKWLGLLMDTPKIVETQKKLNKVIDNLFTTINNFTQVNAAALKTFVNDDLTKDLQSLVKDTRPPSSDTMESAVSRLENGLSFLFNNPIISALLEYSPASLLLKALSKEFGSLIQIPDTTALMTAIGKVVANVAEEEIDNMIRALSGFWDALKGWFNGTMTLEEALKALFSDFVWTLFDSAKILFFALLDLIQDVVAGLTSLLKDKWQLPFISDNWEALTGQDFSPMNVATYILSTVLYLFTETKYNQMPFDHWQIADDFLLFPEEDLDVVALCKRLVAMEKPAEDKKKNVRAEDTSMATSLTTGSADDDEASREEAWATLEMVQIEFTLMSRIIGVFSDLYEMLLVQSNWKEPESSPGIPESNPGAKYDQPMKDLTNWGAATGKGLRSFRETLGSDLFEDDVSWKIHLVFDGIQFLLSVGSTAATCGLGDKPNAFLAKTFSGGPKIGAGIMGVSCFIVCLRGGVTVLRAVLRTSKEPKGSTICNAGNMAAGIMEAAVIDLGLNYGSMTGAEQGSQFGKEVLLGSCLELGSIVFGAVALISSYFAEENPAAALAAVVCGGGEIALALGAVGDGGALLTAQHAPEPVD